MSHLVEDGVGDNLTYRLIGVAMALHNRLGPGYKEEIYERAFADDLNCQGITTQRQFPVVIWNGEVQVGIFYLDLLVEDKVVIEIKAFSHLLTNDERAQVINYLKAAQAPVGLLFNFGRRRLEYQRIFPGRETTSPVQRVGRDNVRKSSRSDHS